jgi:hypothetical protein
MALTGDLQPSPSRAHADASVPAVVRSFVTTRRNGIVIDEDGPWVAACYLNTDPTFIGTEHGLHQRGTLCGLPEDAIVVVRHPFYGTGNDACHECAQRLRELAGQG